ncbi:MAG: FAD-dependent oxidoreductase [Sedimentisphaerales bacterium]|nr:FAD-dependent oxidoreductase [Sedimentisphaerales bacterium]
MTDIATDPVCGMQTTMDDLVYVFRGREYFFCSEGCRQKFVDSPDAFSKDPRYDLVIIGAGPAGLTAAVYASVLKIRTLVLARDIGGQAIDSTKVTNYMGFDFTTGPELVKKFQAQFLHEHFLEHKMDEVTSISSDAEVFDLHTRANQRHQANCVIIATGMKRRKLGIPGEERLLRKGVSHSAVQETSLLEGADVVVVGGGNSGVQAAQELLNAGCRVTLIEKGHLRADELDVATLRHNGRMKILERHDVIEIHGRDRVEAVTVQSMENLKNGRLSCQAVFIQVGLVPNTEFCQDMLELNDRGEIVIGPDCSTSTEGVFACGDVTNAYGKRIIIASGEGAKAALSAKQYLARSKETISR